MRDLTITLIQTNLHWHDIDANLAMLEAKLAKATKPADLILLPEMFSTGFSMQAGTLAETMAGKAVSWLKKTSRQLGADIAGSLMISDRGHYFNRLVWSRPDGQVLTYDKKHLFAYAGEDKVYTAGREQLSVTLHGWRIRPLICYDLRFPVWCRNVSPYYDLAVFTANWPARRAVHWRTLLRARAIENQAFVIGVNRVGTDGNGLDYSGDSVVIDPLGTVLSEVQWEEAVLTLCLQSDVLEQCRARFPFLKDGGDGDSFNQS